MVDSLYSQLFFSFFKMTAEVLLETEKVDRDEDHADKQEEVWHLG